MGEILGSWSWRTDLAAYGLHAIFNFNKVTQTVEKGILLSVIRQRNQHLWTPFEEIA